MVLPSVSVLNSVSVTPSMDILFPLRRRNEVSTLWSSFFLSFMTSAKLYIGYSKLLQQDFADRTPDIAVSCEAMPVPGKYRSGCSQSSIGWNTGSPMKELEKVPKELKGFATL